MGFLRFSTKRKLLPTASVERFGSAIKGEYNRTRAAGSLINERKSIGIAERKLAATSIYDTGSRRAYEQEIAQRKGNVTKLMANPAFKGKRVSDYKPLMRSRFEQYYYTAKRKDLDLMEQDIALKEREKALKQRKKALSL